MHKPVHKVTFFFIASLVMLVPFASINIFSNAMAVEEMNPYMNNEDYSQRYERFYQDDSFRESYYDYHKQHHQQQTSYNNDYSYDSDYEPEYSFYKPNYEQEYNSYENDSNNKDKSKDSEVSSIKKIKCNNINSNLNGVESTTDLNGLLGVGDTALQGDEEVSANAYGQGDRNSNGNFDFDCVNNNNFEGGQGQVGPQGPSGITRLDATNIYSVINSSSPAPGSTFTFASALCDPGDLVLNGGYNLLGSNIVDNESVTTGIDQPIVDPQAGALGAGWFTFVSINEEPSSSELRLNVLALCFDNPPLRP